MKRTYESALKLLDSRRRKARPKEAPRLEDIPLSGNATPTFRGTPSLVGMQQWLQLLGHSDHDINNLNVIHIAGTKGKGSTCAFVRSLLRVHGSRTGFPLKVGMYTSPDLRSIRERIQINQQPIGKEMFTKYFFEVWDRLSSQQQDITGGKEKMPRFLQFLALLALHTFIREEVEATIYETHHGGEYDATNVVRKPIVTGITSIGLDHIAQLGPTIEDIAWHKAGIFKSGTPAFSAPQEPAVAAVLQARAAEKRVELKFVEVDSSLPSNAHALQAPVQRINCSLALALAGTFLERKSLPENHHLTRDDAIQGIEEFSWPGRFEIIEDGSSKWFLDGAHNELSVKQAAEWFSKNTATQRVNGPHPLRILIYTHFSEERDGVALLETLANALIGSGVRPQYVIFTTYQERQDGRARIDKTLKTPEMPFPDFLALYSNLWMEKDPEAVIVRQDAIEGALNFAKGIGKQHNGTETLVTGSLHLVGGALNLLRPLDGDVCFDSTGNGKETVQM